MIVNTNVEISVNDTFLQITGEEMWYDIRTLEIYLELRTILNNRVLKFMIIL